MLDPTLNNIHYIHFFQCYYILLFFTVYIIPIVTIYIVLAILRRLKYAYIDSKMDSIKLAINDPKYFAVVIKDKSLFYNILNFISHIIFLYLQTYPLQEEIILDYHVLFYYFYINNKLCFNKF